MEIRRIVVTNLYSKATVTYTREGEAGNHVYIITITHGSGTVGVVCNGTDLVKVHKFAKATDAMEALALTASEYALGRSTASRFANELVE